MGAIRLSQLDNIDGTWIKYDPNTNLVWVITVDNSKVTRIHYIDLGVFSRAYDIYQIKESINRR